ncbi:thioredoxin [Haloactinopolyspora alba]|uniref:Thioredoxin n=1 Tax=Haloactinopolyspora alba TaxID=648780 RepID=A0A2P8E7I6_9ACTN|nr:thioredoxin [Haloactinopolyspora alba]PSL05430.1 thioredoxin [Haloactinopolyspora alba]
MPTSTTSSVRVVTDDTFADDVLALSTPVLVDFWAQWCPSCRMVAPVVEQIAAERAGTLAVRTINSDENPLIAARYQVRSLPTLMLFRGGEPLWAIVGARPKARLLAEIDDALSR